MDTTLRHSMEDVTVDLGGIYRDFAAQHPYTLITILLLNSIYPELPFKVMYALFIRSPLALLSIPLYLLKFPFYILRGTLRLLGFRKDGVERNSVAARYQASYGGHVPRDSTFAKLQSHSTGESQPERNWFYTILNWAYIVEALRVFWNR